MYTWIANIEKSMTLLEYLMDLGVATKKIHQLCRESALLLDGKPLLSESIVLPKQQIQLRYDDLRPGLGEPAKILWQDEHYLVVDKPSGMLIYDLDHVDTVTLDTTVDRALAQMHVNHADHVHRLDKETSGVILYAKHPIALAAMSQSLSRQLVHRQYVALVEGNFPKPKGRIQELIGSDRHVNGKYRVSRTGKEAITKYETLHQVPSISEVSFELETGRTHQIRVHAAFLGHPLLGDTLYGSRMSASRVMLHAQKISFYHPFTKEFVTITSELPEDYLQERTKRGIHD